MEPSQTGCRFWMVQKSVAVRIEKGTIGWRTSIATYWYVSCIYTMLCGYAMAVLARFELQFGGVSLTSPEVICLKHNSNQVLNLLENLNTPGSSPAKALKEAAPSTKMPIAGPISALRTCFWLLKFEREMSEFNIKLQNFNPTSRIYRGLQVGFAVGRS